METLEATKNPCGDMGCEKIKVTEAEVVVRRTNVGFYFGIKYKEVGEEHYTVGFGSCNIHVVFNWLDKCFEYEKEQ